MKYAWALAFLLGIAVGYVIWAPEAVPAPERARRAGNEVADGRDPPVVPVPAPDQGDLERSPIKEPKDPEPYKTTEARKPAKLVRKSRWDPPADLGHLDSTHPNDRLVIDDLVDTMFDVEAGRDSLDAKEKLIAIGKPAFPRILGAMAEIRDWIADVDSVEERLAESCLKLADECLRAMDGYLTAKSKSTLRPGSEKRYIAYICRLHYKRWQQKLKDMPEMPGPFDPH